VAQAKTCAAYMDFFVLATILPRISRVKDNKKYTVEVEFATGIFLGPGFLKIRMGNQCLLLQDKYWNCI